MGSAKDMEHVTIGLIGLGTVGTGVARILTEHADRIARRAGKRVRWKWAVVRDPAKTRDVKLDGVRVTTDTARLIDDPEVEIVVEAMGGIDPALSIVLDCLAAGKHVVTANKALLAEHGPQIFAQARAAGAPSRSRRASAAASPSSRPWAWRSPPTRCRTLPRSSTALATTSSRR